MSKPVTDTRSVWCRIFLSLLVALLLPACASQEAIEERERQAARTSEERQAVFVMQIDRILQRVPANSPGLIVKVIKNGQTRYQHSVGLADVEKKRLITPDTLFAIGSITKPMTAIALLQLAEKGALSLGDPLGKWIAELPHEWRMESIQRVLSHQTHFNFPEIPFFNGMTNQDFLDRLRDVKTWQPLSDQPVGYSNEAYMLLAQVIEAASGMSYSDYLKYHIFNVAGMSTAAVSPNPFATDRHIALNYGFSPFQYRRSFYLHGAGGVYASVHDIERFSLALLAGKLVSPDSLRLMTSDHSHAIVNEAFSSHYGYGWFVPRDSEGGAVFYHSGRSDGYQSLLYIDQRSGVIAVMLSNGGDTTGKLITAASGIVVNMYPE